MLLKGGKIGIMNNQYRIIKRNEKYVIQVLEYSNGPTYQTQIHPLTGRVTSYWRDLVTVSDLEYAREKKRQYIHGLNENESFVE